MDWNSGLGKSPKELAENLKNIYDTKFGGKFFGRYRTSRMNFRRLSGLPNLPDDYIKEVGMWLRKMELILIDMDRAFLVIPVSITDNYRRVPESVIEKYVADNEAGSESQTDSQS